MWYAPIQFPRYPMTKNDKASTGSQPRAPNAEELRQLTGWLASEGYIDETVNCAYVAVHEHYVSGCPGYAGKVMSVVWDVSPSFFDVFIWEKGRIAPVERYNAETK